MAKGDKEYMWRREGMVYAIKQVKENGIDDFVNEVKRRGLLKLDIHISDNQIIDGFKQISNNLYNTMIPVFYTCLVDEFDFKKEDLQKLHSVFTKQVDSLLSLDYLGEHYVTMKDFQEEINEKYGFDFDGNVADDCMNSFDDSDERYHMIKLESLIDMLYRDGFPAAALHIKRKVEKSDEKGA
jgi:hypothetical protein